MGNLSAQQPQIFPTTISQEEEQFKPLGYWEAKGYSRAQILQDATEADVRHNVPMKGTCYRVSQQTKKKIFASRLYKREELGASGSVKKAGGLMKAARKSLKADKAALLAEQKLERVEKAEGGPHEVQLLGPRREAHVEFRERPTRRRVLGQLYG